MNSNHPPLPAPRPALVTRTARIGAALIVAGLLLVGCGQVAPTVPPSGTPSSPAPTTSPTMPPTPTSQTPSPSPSASTPSVPAQKATGSLKLFTQASTKLVGSCAADGAVKLADAKNDFFGTIDVALTSTSGKVGTVTIDLGEDSELVTRKLTYDAAKPVAGTSATLAARGSKFILTGRLASAENGEPAGTMPVTLTWTCAAS